MINNELRKLFVSECEALEIETSTNGLPEVIIRIGEYTIMLLIKDSKQNQLSHYQYKTCEMLQKGGMVIGICFDGLLDQVYEFNAHFKKDLTKYKKNKESFKIPIDEWGAERIQAKMKYEEETEKRDRRKIGSKFWRHNKGKEEIDRLKSLKLS